MKKLFRLDDKKVLSIPPILYLTALFLVPLIIMIVMAFRQPGAYGGVEPIFARVNDTIRVNLSLDSFKFAFSQSFLWQLCLRSLKYSIITTFSCLLLGYPLAFLIARSSKKVRDFLLLLVIIPFWSCFLIRIYAWMIILGPQSVVNHAINYVITLTQ